jgi:hypothetical protein
MALSLLQEVVEQDQQDWKRHKQQQNDSRTEKRRELVVISTDFKLERAGNCGRGN